MSEIREFVEYPGTTERNAAPTLESCCESAAGEWLCTRLRGHEMPHQAGAGYEGSDIFAEWTTPPATEGAGA